MADNKEKVPSTEELQAKLKENQKKQAEAIADITRNNESSVANAIKAAKNEYMGIPTQTLETPPSDKNAPNLTDLGKDEDRLKKQLEASKFQDDVNDLINDAKKEVEQGRIRTNPVWNDMSSNFAALAAADAQREAEEKAEAEARAKKALEAKLSPEGMDKFIREQVADFNRYEKMNVEFTNRIVGEASQGLSSGDPKYQAAEELRQAYNPEVPDIKSDGFKAIVDKRAAAYKKGFESGLFDETKKGEILGQLDKSIKGVESMKETIDKRMDLLEKNGKDNSDQYKMMQKMRDNLQYEYNTETNFKNQLINGSIQVKKAEPALTTPAPTTPTTPSAATPAAAVDAVPSVEAEAAKKALEAELQKNSMATPATPNISVPVANAAFNMLQGGLIQSLAGLATSSDFMKAVTDFGKSVGLIQNQNPPTAESGQLSSPPAIPPITTPVNGQTLSGR